MDRAPSQGGWRGIVGSFRARPLRRRRSWKAAVLHRTVCTQVERGFRRAGRGSLAASADQPHTHDHLINWSCFMPKMKTKKSAAKRFVVRPGGTVKRGQAFKRHILTKKTTKNKRHLRGSTAVHEADMNSGPAMLPFA